MCWALTFPLRVPLNPAHTSTPSSLKQQWLKCSSFQGKAQLYVCGGVYKAVCSQAVILFLTKNLFTGSVYIRHPGFYQLVFWGLKSQEG